MTGSDSATRLLVAWRDGDPDALDRLIPLVHDELRRLARAYMAGERPGHTLQPTALVNEAYVRLVNLRQIDWQDRPHFIAMAARIMRRVLVDAARTYRSDKRGGGIARVPLDPDGLEAPAVEDLLGIDDALRKLAAAYPRAHDVVELRYFGGLTIEQTADALDISTDTVKRDWRFAKLWLLRELRH